MKLLCITGMPGCGKEEFVRAAEEKGIHVLRMGEIVRAEAQKRGLEFSNESVGGLAHDERLKHGYGIWAERTLAYLDTDKDIVVVEGIRCPEEVEVFRKSLKNAELVIVAIHSSPKTRRKRLMDRHRGDDIVSQEEFERRDRRELSWGLSKVIALADYMVINEGSLKNLRAEALKFLRAQGLVI